MTISFQYDGGGASLELVLPTTCYSSDHAKPGKQAVIYMCASQENKRSYICVLARKTSGHIYVC